MIINLKQNTKEWLEYRATKFNASETSCLFGVGFYKPYQLAQFKYNNVNHHQNEAMRLGNEYEPKIREIVEKQELLSFKPVVIQWDKDTRFSASLDGFNAETNTILEIKFSANEYQYLIANDKPSDKYEIQIQHQLMVSGCDYCIFAVGFIDDDIELMVKTIKVYPRREFWGEIVEKWENFEKEYQNETIDSEFMDIQWELTHLNDEVKERENRIKELKSRLIEKANGKELKFANITIYKSIRKGDFDYKAYCKDNGINPSEDYKKQDSEFWSVKIS